MKYLTAPTLALAALLCAIPAHGQVVIPTYQLIYNAADGSLSIDTLGNPLYNYIIQGTGDLSLNDGFFEANHLLIPDAPGPEGSSATSSDDQLSQSDFNGWFGLAPHNLGNVLPAGLSDGQLNAALDLQDTRYARALGSLGNIEFFYNFDIVYNVPEPSSIVLLGVGTALLAQRRRQR